MTLFGRRREVGAVDALVGGIRAAGGGLVIWGEPGIGKSGLLEHAAARARADGVVVLRGAGVQSEAKLPFAGLHQLLGPMLGRLGELPPRQRDALAAAFGMAPEGAPGTAPEPFMIALAALTLLSDAAAAAPLLLAVDDAQWMDRPTVDVLGFVARRLGTEPIVLLLAVRDGYPTPLKDCGIPELRLRRLDEDAAASLLDESAPELAPELRRRVLAEAAGVPLALVELPRALDARGPGGDTGFLPLTDRLERAFALRVAELPAPTRALLLVAAADDGGAIGELLAAASLVTGADAARDRGERAPAEFRRRAVGAAGVTVARGEPVP
ncbi:AAA family ATPase, partial [Actinomadura fibrosa]|uniref:AAA family ATPase n=1 Tax=Actinomadura fibrosa TaxID=111802 RepID=UPI0013F15DF3